MANELPKIRVVRHTKNFVTFKKEDLENLKFAYYYLYIEHKNDKNVGQAVKNQWLGHYLMLSEICRTWAFPSIECKREK